MKKFSLLILFALISTTIFAQQKIKIKGAWQFHQEGTKESYPAIVPGSIHQDLMRNEVIEDIYYENNEHKYQWIENKNWVYQTQFEVDTKTFSFDHQILDFEGLDTYAKVYLNDSLILVANNMFRSWKVDVKRLLLLGKNHLKLVFLSPIEQNKSKVKNSPYVLPAGCETVAIKVSPYTRKAAYHFGWDWGPRVVSSGIWKPIFLKSWNKASIKNFWASTIKVEKDLALVKFSCELDCEDIYKDQLSFQLDGKLRKFNYNPNSDTYDFTLQISNPKLWWPRTHGTPHLSNYKLQLRIDNKPIDEKIMRFGIRQIELIHEADSIGTAFYFKVNGIPIFMKGANYIPQDLLVPRVQDKQYENLLDKVEEANMNMIRVWGGGIYERDIFYELCDEKGILVWQDFMFAGSMYPNDPAFLANVKEEVSDNIRRLRHHPSIAIWCGNNEMEVAWHNWGWQKQYNYSAADSTEIWQNYLKIFHNIIPDQLQKLDPNRPYTSTSPLSNWGTPANFNHASMHYWGVWHGREPFSNFKKNVGRFMVEYGFQSFPSIHHLKKVLPDSSLYLASAAMKNRQKSYIGNGMITKHVERNFRPANSFEDFVYLSQKTQALGMKIAIQEHRKAMPHCMGTLFWQLNDCWPGPSWSVLDYYGERKLAFQEVKNNFSAVIATIDTTANNFQIHLVSDLQKSIQGQVQISAIKEGKTKWSKRYSVAIPANSSKAISSKALKKMKRKLEKCKRKKYDYQILVLDSQEKVLYKDFFQF